MESKSSLSVPIAIVVAGLIIGGAVYISSRNPGTPAPVATTDTQPTTIMSGELPIAPISQKDYIRGNPNAKVVIVEFSDTECPYCKTFHGTMKGLVDKYAKNGTLAWVYRNFPIKEIHSKAPKESEALLCAGKLGGSNVFWDFTDRVYAKTASNNSLDPAQLPIIAKDAGLDVTAFNTCLSSGEMASAVEADHADAVKSGGNGTPYSVFIPNKAFDKTKMEKFLTDSIIKFGFPAKLFFISSDNKKLGVSGAMPQEFMESLVKFLAQ